MKKIIISALIAFAPLSAFAYSLPGPVSVDTVYQAGEGQVNFDRPSVLEATFTVDNITDGESYITAGDVQNGARGYGFARIGQMLYAVTNNGGIAQKMPLAFVYPGVATHAIARYTPGDAIRVDTDSNGAGFTQYSRGIVFGSLPTTGFFPALNATTLNATLNIGSWSYTDKITE